MAEELAASVFVTLSGNGSVITLEDLMAAIGGADGEPTPRSEGGSEEEAVGNEELKEQARAILQRLGAGPETTSVSFEQFEDALQGLDENVLRMLAPATTASSEGAADEYITHGDEDDAATRPQLNGTAERGHAHARSSSQSLPVAFAGDVPTPASMHSNGADARKKAETEAFGSASGAADSDDAQGWGWQDRTHLHDTGTLQATTLKSNRTANGADCTMEDDEHTMWRLPGSVQSPRSPQEDSSGCGRLSGRSSVTLTSPVIESGGLADGQHNGEGQGSVPWETYAALMQDNKNLRAANDRLAHRLRETEQRLKDNETELLELSQEETKMAAETTAEITALKREIDRLRKERYEREEREDQAEDATRQEFEREHAARVRQLEDEHRKEVEAKEAAVVDLQEEAFRLKEALEEKDNEMRAQQRRHETEVGVLETQLRTQTAAFEQLEAEAGELRFAADTLKDMEADNRRLRDRLDEALHANTQQGFGVDGSGGEGGDGTTTATAESARPVAFDLAVEHKLDTIKADHRRERARLQMSLVVARLRVESITKELKEQSINLVAAKQDNDSLQLQLDVLGKSLADMKRFVDTDNSVVRRLGPRGSGSNPLTAFMRRFSVDRNI